MKKDVNWSVGKAAKKVSGKAIDAAKSKSVETYQNFAESQKALSSENWFERTAQTCEALSDATMGSSGWTNRLVSVASGKLGAIAAPASLFTVASLVGTASTGTALGTLSGAAYTSAALAWIGGSVAVGTAIVATAGAGGLIAAPLLVKPLSKKYLTGKERKPDDLSRTESDLVNACCALAIGLRRAARDGASLDRKQALALHNDALKPLLDKSADVLWESREWPLLQRRNFNDAFWHLGQAKGFASSLAASKEPVAIGLATVLVLNLLSAGEHEFSDSELDVLDAIRRSSGKLHSATNEEIAAHVQAMSPEQLRGFKNNVKGIAHEIQFARLENSDGDEFQVELFEATNHAGADVRLINTETGEVRELQLKATSYEAYVEEHFAKYPEIEVLVADEVATQLGIGSSGVTNKQLSEDVDTALDRLAPSLDVDIAESMAIAGLVTLARNVNVILTSDPDQKPERKELVANSLRAGLVAGIAELLI